MILIIPADTMAVTATESVAQREAMVIMTRGLEAAKTVKLSPILKWALELAQCRLALLVRTCPAWSLSLQPVSGLETIHRGTDKGARTVAMRLCCHCI